MDFDSYQTRARETDEIPSTIKGIEKLNYCILGACNQIGEISSVAKKRMRDGDDYKQYKNDVVERLGFLLWYISAACDSINVMLNSVADRNLNFNDQRWALNPKKQSEYDDGFPKDQTLPEYVWVHFEVQPGDPDKIAATSFLNGVLDAPIPFGDPVDDNANTEDGYRFHDAFHIAYYALLGWSPVVRKFWDCKRRKDKDKDRIEDGARARDREEAATVFIYKYSSDHNFFDQAEFVDTGLLAMARKITDDLEVRTRTDSDWQNAIIAASRVQKKLIDNNGGWIYASRQRGEINYSKSGPSGISSK